MSRDAVIRITRRALYRRRPVQPSSSSRAFADEILSDLAGSRWSVRGWLRFSWRSAGRSWEQVRAHRRAALELTGEHALLLAARPGCWAGVSWLMSITHLGLLDEHRTGLGWPNRLTLLRANLPAVVPPPAPWTAFVALASDWLDGRLARRRGVTPFGGYADALTDIAFWMWFVRNHEESRTVRTLTCIVWLTPAAAAIVTSIARGHVIQMPRLALLRDVSVGLQVLVALRAISSPASLKPGVSYQPTGHVSVSLLARRRGAGGGTRFTLPSSVAP